MGEQYERGVREHRLKRKKDENGRSTRRRKKQLEETKKRKRKIKVKMFINRKLYGKTMGVRRETN